MVTKQGDFPKIKKNWVQNFYTSYTFKKKDGLND